MTVRAAHKTIPVAAPGTRVLLEDLFQVVLHNDDMNTVEHVVESLMRIFGHTRPLAEKITLEAHHRGRAIAEVESETPALQHRDQLLSRGLIATVERIG